MVKRLEGKVSMITGAGSGIGRATAFAFAKEGAKVIVNDVQLDAGEKVTSEINEHEGVALFVGGDVSREGDVVHMVDAAEREFGRIDVLFNNAGGSLGVRFPVAETNQEDWDRVIEVNLKGIFLVSKYVLPVMIKKGGGVIINMGSSFGLVGFPNMAAYTAAKGGVIALTRQMAVDYGTYNIRVNCMCPGPILTPLVESRIKEAPDPEESLNELKSLSPLGKIGRPEDVAYMALYLASDESPFTTGAVLAIDGGHVAR
jgi:NAD(P)-dependent dehydrogenase (short-subunit alcohol dehydrogenase family)